MPNGHVAAETVVMTTQRLEAERLQAERAAYIEQMRRQMEEERERRRAIIAEVGLLLSFSAQIHFFFAGLVTLLLMERREKLACKFFDCEEEPRSCLHNLLPFLRDSALWYA